MSILLGVILVFAALTLTLAVTQAVAMVRIAPASENLAGFLPLGWWKFRQLEQKAGPAAAQPLNLYKRAVIAFLVFLVLGVVLSGWTVNQRPAPVGSASLTSGAAFAPVFDLRRVAMVPGNTVLES